ncbi:MAG: N-acetyltransferase [Alphaproteobacteria bacterium]|nr:N-acetyltransferase [Alphaproteobacteria bacterium]
MTDIILEKPDHHIGIESLLDQAFGQNRYQKTSYQYRQSIPPVKDLCHVIVENDQVIATIRYWQILIDQHPISTLLLGPIAVAKSHRGLGLGLKLGHYTLNKAAELGYELAFLVGDIAYYQRFGFEFSSPYGFVMPNEKAERLLVKELNNLTTFLKNINSEVKATLLPLKSNNIQVA